MSLLFSIWMDNTHDMARERPAAMKRRGQHSDKTKTKQLQQQVGRVKAELIALNLYT